MALELGDHWKGQFFTPYSVCQLMAQITFTGKEELIEQQGFMTMNEPTAGAGAMVIALCETMMNAKVNYQKKLHVVAQDLDETAVHMTYIQLSLLHVPAAIVHGNSLMVENRATWWTPAHIMGGWSHKLIQRDAVESIECASSFETVDESAAQQIDLRIPPPENPQIVKQPLQQMDLFV
jgi:hypothetical protein